MSEVKFYFSTIRTRVIPILKRIEVGDYPSKIARWHGWSRQHVNYYCKKLAKAKIIRRTVRSSAVFYELTSKGKKFLAGCEGVIFGSGVFRLHHCCVKFRIVREGVYPSGDFRRVELVNWTALLGLVHGVSVRKTTRHWIVQCETAYGKHPGELFSLVGNLANRVAHSLQSKYGVILGEGQIQKGYELAVDDPVADFLKQFFEVSTDKRKMDHSEIKGEIDHLTRDSAIEYLLMPERVKKMQGQMLGFDTRLEDIESTIQSLTKLFSNALKPTNTKSSSVAGPSSEPKYIS